MAFIKCPNCGKQYSDKIGKCPFCVAERKEQPSRQKPTIRGELNKPLKPSVVFLGIMVAIIVVAGMNYRDNKKAEAVKIETAKKQASAEQQRLRKERAAKRKADRLAERAAMTPQELRTERIEKGFSGWDGSHVALTRLIKKAMNDPDSYKHAETTYIDRGDYLIVKTTFRGKNKFGGMVKNWVRAKADLDGNIIEIINQGP